MSYANLANRFSQITAEYSADDNVIARIISSLAESMIFQRWAHGKCPVKSRVRSAIICHMIYIDCPA